MIGATLGHYHLIEQVGAGGVGVVYLARDERLEREVAVKVLSPRNALTGAARRNFRREALALSRASHPNIATIHDFNNQDGLDYLVMEYIVGRPLSAHVLSGPLSNEETVALGCQLADGLAFAHSKGVVHGDLKPGNIRVTPDGRLKILDFGLARVTASGDTTTQTMTGTGGLGGTLPYMAPEQIRGQVADQRSDVYAAGAVLYEMATGHRPFNATNDAALMNAILRGKPDPPTETNPHISSGLSAIVVKALDLDPSLRYQSATELQVDLHRLGGRSVPIARRRVGWRAVATYLLVAAAAIVVAAIGGRHLGIRETPPLTTTEMPSSSGGRLRVELTPPEVIGASTETGQWPRVIHALMASDLAAVQEISLLDRAAGREGKSTREATGDSSLAVRMRVLSLGPSRELECSVVESKTEEVTFVVRTSIVSEDQLPAGVHELSSALTEYFRVRSSGPEFANDLRPWISSRSYNVRAVRAFVQGAMYVFRYLPGEPQRYYQRALEIEPTFVAPRIWRLAPLLQQGKVGDARADLAYLRSIEAQASPFEQAMIAYAGALLDMNAAAQARHIEVALRYAPGNRVLLVSLALAQELQGDCRAMLDTIRPLVERRWAYAPLYGQWARCTIELGLVDEARRTLEASLTLVPAWPEVYAFLEALAMVRDDTVDAARYAKLVRARLNELGTPERTQPLASAYSRVGEHALRIKAFPQALQLFAKASEFDPSEPEYHDRLAETLESLGRTRESQQERNRAGALRGRGR